MIRYEKASTLVKGLENQANHLSSEARDESNMARSLLKDITAMEHDITSPLKVTAQNLYFTSRE